MATESSANARGTFRTLNLGFDEAAAKVPELLAKQGFGIVTQIDFRETFRAKLGVEFGRYRVFGACNPAFALRALTADPHVGLLLPCNVALYEREGGRTELGVVDPLQTLGNAIDDEPLAVVAQEVSARLERFLEEISAAKPSATPV